MELRSYVAARDRLDAAKDKTDVPRTRMVNFVFTIKAEIMRLRNIARGLVPAASE